MAASSRRDTRRTADWAANSRALPQEGEIPWALRSYRQDNVVDNPISRDRTFRLDDAVHGWCTVRRYESPSCGLLVDNISGLRGAMRQQAVGDRRCQAVLCNQEVTGSIPVRSIKRVETARDARP